MKTNKLLYFAYGANIDVAAMSWRCPGAEPVRAFELRDWQLEFYSHATIEHRPGNSVHGVLWNLTEECEQSLDVFEGFPSYYTKRTWNQDGHWFFFYEMAGYKQGSPSSGYIHGIANGYDQWQLPQDSLQQALDRTNGLHRYDFQY